MKISIGKLIAQFVGLFVVFALLLFLPAGTLDWAAGWVFLALFFGCSIAITVWLLKANPGLLDERMTGLGKADQKSWDKAIMVLIQLFFWAWLVVMPLDAVRFQWSHVPLWTQAVGGVIFVLGFYVMFLAYRENSFLSPAVRIQQERGHTVVTTGPYRHVRHPMYAGAVLFFLGATLLLGSWFGLLVGLLLSVVMAHRAVLEEATLRAELPGYAEYTTQVKYHLIPYLW